MGTTTTGESRALPPTATITTQSAPISGMDSPRRDSYTPPDEPLAVIQPDKSWGLPNLRETWAHRELLYFLILRDVKVRYKQTLLGVAWVVMQPLLMTIIFTVLLGVLAHVPSGNIPYPLLVFSGILPWTFFSNAITNSGNSLVGSAHLITKVYFPRLLIPAASIGAGLVDFSISFIIMAGMMLYYRVPWTPRLLMLPVLVALTTLLATGVGMWLSALNVKYRDVRHALPFLMQIWLYVSPIVYPASVVPQKWRLLYSLNPVVGIVEGYRSALFGRDFDWAALGISAALTTAVLFYAALAFRRMERSFADLV